MHALLRWLGIACMIAGAAVEIIGYVKRPHGRTAASAVVRPAATVGPAAPALTTGLYAQNLFYRATASLTAPTLLRYTIETRFTERLTIGFDRPVTTCRSIQGPRRTMLHVFPIAGIPGYSAIAFFTTATRQAPRHTVDCTLAEPVSSARTDGDALVPIDGIVAHHRLEYAAHAQLAGLPRALYPPRDPMMRRVSLSLGGPP
jgi:hypothetical protein